MLLDTTSWAAGGWFKNPPTMLGEILAKDLRELPLKKGPLLQYCAWPFDFQQDRHLGPEYGVDFELLD